MVTTSNTVSTQESLFNKSKCTYDRKAEIHVVHSNSVVCKRDLYIYCSCTCADVKSFHILHLVLYRQRILTEPWSRTVDGLTKTITKNLSYFGRMQTSPNKLPCIEIYSSNGTFQSRLLIYKTNEAFCHWWIFLKMGVLLILNKRSDGVSFVIVSWQENA